MSSSLPPPVHPFVLSRDEDATGVSGTGIVAQGVVFADGSVAMRWLTPWRSTAVYESIDHVRAIHGHNGSTHVVWEEEGDWVPDDQATDDDGRYTRPAEVYARELRHAIPTGGLACIRCGLLLSTIAATERRCSG